MKRKNSDMEIFVRNQYGERLATLYTENIKICGWVTKLEAIKFEFWILPKVGYLATITIEWPISTRISVPNFRNISSFTTEKKIAKFKMAAAAILNLKKCNFGPQWPLYGDICKPNLVQIGPEIAEVAYTCLWRPPSWICFTPILDRTRRSPWWAKFSC